MKNISMRTRLVLLFLFVLLGQIGHAFGEEYRSIHLGGFSPDGSKFTLSYCTVISVCKFGYYDIPKREFVELTTPEKDQVFGPGGFSPDGRRIAVSVRRSSEGGRYSQIGILELSNHRLTTLSNSPTYKIAPSFSHDGKKIIFAQSNRERESGATRFSDWDIYELSIDGKSEHRLTAYNFYQASPPAYLPGDERFIFSGDSPKEYVSITGRKGYKAYSEQYQDNRVFVISPASKQRLTPLFTKGVFSSSPRISTDGSRIFYKSRTDKTDGIKTRFTYDLFLFDGSEHKRLTQASGQVVDFSVSYDGSQIVFVKQMYRERNVSGLNLLDVGSGQIETLIFADQSGN